MLTCSDKGNKTVIIYKSLYEEKMYELLNDANTYQCLDITISKCNKTLENKHNRLLKNLQKQIH